MVKDQIDLKEECKQLLISNNIPVTRPRILLLEILLKNKGPLKVEDIIKLSEGKLALSSLYRIINSLKDLNLISEFQTPDKTKVIELSNIKDDHHHHIFCKSCGAINDFELNDALEKNLMSNIKGTHRNGSSRYRLPNTSHLSFDDVDAGDLLILANDKGLCIASGSACSTGTREPSRIMKAMGHTDERALSSIRLSVSSMNTDQEIEESSQIIIACVEKIRSLRSDGPVIFSSDK